VDPGDTSSGNGRKLKMVVVAVAGVEADTIMQLAGNYQEK
jgi:hypothetical protein